MDKHCPGPCLLTGAARRHTTQVDKIGLDIHCLTNLHLLTDQQDGPTYITSTGGTAPRETAGRGQSLSRPLSFDWSGATARNHTKKIGLDIHCLTNLHLLPDWQDGPTDINSTGGMETRETAGRGQSLSWPLSFNRIGATARDPSG